MLLTLTTTYQPATDLGFLLHKHPERFQSVDLAIGKAHIFYPERTATRTTMALLLDMDAIDLVKGRKGHGGKEKALTHYINDRPYVASSFMSVALAKAFSTALNGTCAQRPELVEVEMPFVVKIAVVAAPNGGEALIRKLFEPLGYQVEVQAHMLDENFPDWGPSVYFTVVLSNTITLQRLLAHLYVLIPVLDHQKHYFVSENEIQKLLDKGHGWLEDHPEKEQITRRYLVSLHSLARQALAHLQADDPPAKEAASSDRKPTLHQQRLAVVLERLKQSEVASIIDLGCGEGRLLRLLLQEKQFTHIAGMDVSAHQLIKAKERLHWGNMSPKQKERITLFQGALTYKDQRLEGFDAATLVEVIEHLDEARLTALEKVVFGFAQPKMVLVTTPNAEYNALFENLESGALRHADHRFEWTRHAFEAWATRAAETYGYTVEMVPIGPIDEAVGAPSQMGVFTHGT